MIIINELPASNLDEIYFKGQSYIATPFPIRYRKRTNTMAYRWVSMRQDIKHITVRSI